MMNNMFKYKIIIFYSFIVFVLYLSICFSQEINNKIINVNKISNEIGSKIKFNKKNRKFYLLNFEQNNVKVLDTTYKIIKKIGRFGQGDGEFYLPLDFDIDFKNRFWIIDHFNARIQVIKTDGMFIKKFQKNNRIFSITHSKYDNTIYVNNPTDDGMFSTLTLNGWQQKFLGFNLKNKWLSSIINSINKDDKLKKNLFEKYNESFNISLIRSDNIKNNIYLLSFFTPIISKFKTNGKIVFQKEIDTKYLSAEANSIINTNKDLIINELNRSKKVLFQDLYIDPLDEYLYIIPTLSNLLKLNKNGNIIGRYCFIDKKTKTKIFPLCFIIYKGKYGIITSNSGIYNFNLKSVSF